MSQNLNTQPTLANFVKAWFYKTIGKYVFSLRYMSYYIHLYHENTYHYLPKCSSLSFSFLIKASLAKPASAMSAGKSGFLLNSAGVYNVRIERKPV